MKRPGRRTRCARVSLSPSKIPYGGFSPVRLQTGSRVRSSSKDLYAPQSRVHTVCRSPKGAIGIIPLQPRSARHASPEVLRSVAGFVVPLTSSATMTSSAPLVVSPRFMDYSVGSLPKPTTRGSPIYSARVYQRAAFRTPPDHAVALGCCFPACISLRHLCIGSASGSRIPVGVLRSVFRGCKVRFMLRPAGWLALHRQGLLPSSFHLRGHPLEMSNMTTRVNSQFPRPDLHRQHTQRYGLQAEGAEERRGVRRAQKRLVGTHLFSWCSSACKFARVRIFAVQLALRDPFKTKKRILTCVQVSDAR